MDFDTKRKLFWHKYPYPEKPRNKIKESIILMTAVFIIWPLMLYFIDKAMDSLGKDLPPIDRETIQADLNLGVGVGCWVVSLSIGGRSFTRESMALSMK